MAGSVVSRTPILVRSMCGEARPPDATTVSGEVDMAARLRATAVPNAARLKAGTNNGLAECVFRPIGWGYD